MSCATIAWCVVWWMCCDVWYAVCGVMCVCGVCNLDCGWTFLYLFSVWKQMIGPGVAGRFSIDRVVMSHKRHENR